MRANDRSHRWFAARTATRPHITFDRAAANRFEAGSRPLFTAADRRRWVDKEWRGTESVEEGVGLPVACTLKPAELAAMRNGLLPGLLSRASSREQIAGGFRWRFDPQVNLVKEAGTVIDAEHRCCRFLRFRLLVEPGDGPVWLEVTGPEGTADFLSALVDTPTDSMQEATPRAAAEPER